MGPYKHKTNCDNCAGLLKSNVCEYCGTQYHQNQVVIPKPKKILSEVEFLENKIDAVRKSRGMSEFDKQEAIALYSKQLQLQLNFDLLVEDVKAAEAASDEEAYRPFSRGGLIFGRCVFFMALAATLFMFMNMLLK